MTQVQVHLRVPLALIKELDRWVEQGRFASRSDAIKSVLSLYEERERTMEFARMLFKRREEARASPKMLVPLGG